MPFHVFKSRTNSGGTLPGKYKGLKTQSLDGINTEMLEGNGGVLRHSVSNSSMHTPRVPSAVGKMHGKNNAWKRATWDHAGPLLSVSMKPGESLEASLLKFTKPLQPSQQSPVSRAGDDVTSQQQSLVSASKFGRNSLGGNASSSPTDSRAYNFYAPAAPSTGQIHPSTGQSQSSTGQTHEDDSAFSSHVPSTGQKHDDTQAALTGASTYEAGARVFLPGAMRHQDESGAVGNSMHALSGSLSQTDPNSHGEEDRKTGSSGVVVNPSEPPSTDGSVTGNMAGACENDDGKNAGVHGRHDSQDRQGKRLVSREEDKGPCRPRPNSPLLLFMGEADSPMLGLDHGDGHGHGDGHVHGHSHGDDMVTVGNNNPRAPSTPGSDASAFSEVTNFRRSLTRDHCSPRKSSGGVYAKIQGIHDDPIAAGAVHSVLNPGLDTNVFVNGNNTQSSSAHNKSKTSANTTPNPQQSPALGMATGCATSRTPSLTELDGPHTRLSSAHVTELEQLQSLLHDLKLSRVDGESPDHIEATQRIQGRSAAGTPVLPICVFLVLFPSRFCACVHIRTLMHTIMHVCAHTKTHSPTHPLKHDIYFESPV